MSTAELTPLVSSLPGKTVRTGADTESPMSRDDTGDDNVVERWQTLIDRMIDWGWNQGEFEDEGIEPPNREVVRLAILLAQRFKEERFRPPDSVVPDPNGGIVFELRENGDCEVWHVWDDGVIEYQRFQGTHLVERGTL